MGVAALAAAMRAGILAADDAAMIVVDFDRLDQRLDIVRRAFPSEVLHAVAIKTNPLAAVLAHLVRRGFGLEAASFEELERAAEAGATPSAMVFDSPVKTRREIQSCGQRWPGLVVNANTLAELGRHPVGSSVRLGLRINPLVAVDTDHRYDVSTPTSKFGVRRDRVDDIIRAAIDAPIVGLHVHSGSGITDALANVDVVRSLAQLASTIDDARAQAGVPTRIEYLDIGGGLAFQVEDEGMLAFGRAVASLPGIGRFQLITEFGQWVHAPAGIVCTRVEYVDDHGDGPARAFVHVGADLFTRGGLCSTTRLSLHGARCGGSARRVRGRPRGTISSVRCALPVIGLPQMSSSRSCPRAHGSPSTTPVRTATGCGLATAAATSLQSWVGPRPTDRLCSSSARLSTSNRNAV